MHKLFLPEYIFSNNLNRLIRFVQLKYSAILLISVRKVRKRQLATSAREQLASSSIVGVMGEGGAIERKTITRPRARVVSSTPEVPDKPLKDLYQ